MRIEPATPTAPPPGPSQAGTAISKFRRLASRFIVPATTQSAGPRAAFDIEANGLLRNATKLHCIVVVDLDSNQIDQYGPDQIGAGLAHLSRIAYLVGHNTNSFDIPVLQRLYRWQPRSDCKFVDTLVAGRLILPGLEELDDKAAAMGDPKLGKLRGRYSIEAWGARLRIPKIGTDIKDWSQWTPEMQQRCVADALICKALWQFLQPDGYSQDALELEYRVAAICEQITLAGVPFDVAAARQRRQQWTKQRDAIGARLQRQFPDVNLDSRKQLGELFESRGWTPSARTEKTKQAKINDETLESLPALYPEFAGLADYMILGRRIAQLSTGKQAWGSHVDADGRIHGGLVHIGTPHSRAKHLAPNIAQVPNPKRGKPFAAECRSLFRTNDDWVFVCCDQAGLQDRGFAHYLSEFDGGDYAKAFLDGLDPHWKTATDLGLIAPGTALNKTNTVHVAIREGAKSFRYGFLYGAGFARAGHIVGGIIRTVMQIDPGNGLHRQFFGNAARPSEVMLRKIGKDAIGRFVRGTPGLGRLRLKLQERVQRFGWLSGLDGRRVPVSAQYKALNFIVTSSEAILTKRWLVRVYDELKEKFRYGWNGDVVITLWVHDEIACCCRPEIAEQVGEIMVQHAKEPATFYDFKVPLAADYKIGRSWAGDPVNGAEVCDAVLPEYRGSGAPKITHPRPSGAVELVGEHCATVENSKNATAATPPRQSGEAPNDIDDVIIEDWSHINIDAIKIRPGAGAGNSHGYPHGEQRKGRRVSSFLYRDHLSGPHTRVEKRKSVDARHAQYPQSFYVNGAWVNKKPAGWLKVPYRLPEMLEGARQKSKR